MNNEYIITPQEVHRHHDEHNGYLINVCRLPFSNLFQVKWSYDDSGDGEFFQEIIQVDDMTDAFDPATLIKYADIY